MFFFSFECPYCPPPPYIQCFTVLQLCFITNESPRSVVIKRQKNIIIQLVFNKLLLIFFFKLKNPLFCKLINDYPGSMHDYKNKVEAHHEI